VDETVEFGGSDVFGLTNELKDFTGASNSSAVAGSVVFPFVFPI
jgi:hypothetical protein